MEEKNLGVCVWPGSRRGGERGVERPQRRHRWYPPDLRSPSFQRGVAVVVIAFGWEGWRALYSVAVDVGGFVF